VLADVIKKKAALSDSLSFAFLVKNRQPHDPAAWSIVIG
jgi:hypothetical protein